VLFIISQVCEALAEAHSLNLLHRDIKPQNIMLSLDQSVGDWAVLFDYGLAKPLGSVVDAVQSAETHWSGTPTYMAPERFRQSDSMDRRSDIYSLGCVAYFLLSGRPPFIEHETESLFAMILSEQPASLSQQRQESVPDEVSQLVFKCMAKRPDDRFESISQLADAIASMHHRYPWTVDDAKGWWKAYGEESDPAVGAAKHGNAAADPT
jgi:serine/threonine protein kinase